MTKHLKLVIGAIVFGAACASAPPTEEAQNSSAAIRSAEAVGAHKVPKAAYHLQLAREEFEHASKLTDSHDRPQAARLLQRAEADADLALALARSDAERKEAQAAIDKVNRLSGAVQR